MTDDEGVYEPTEEHRKNDEIQVGTPLTAQQRESLRRTAASVRKSLASPVMLPAFTVPESVLKNAVAATDLIGAQQALVADAIKPLLDAQAAWREQIAGMVTSDAFKGIAQNHRKFADIAAQLTTRRTCARSGIWSSRTSRWSSCRTAFRSMACRVQRSPRL